MVAVDVDVVIVVKLSVNVEGRNRVVDSKMVENVVAVAFNLIVSAVGSRMVVGGNEDVIVDSTTSVIVDTFVVSNKVVVTMVAAEVIVSIAVEVTTSLNLVNVVVIKEMKYSVFVVTKFVGKLGSVEESTE